MSKIDSWLSTAAGSLLIKQKCITAAAKKPAKSRSDAKTIRVETDVFFQRMDGFGASFTDSASYLFQRCLSPEQRHEVFANLFTPRGINLSVIRNPIGACDYNLNMWTYCDSGEFAQPDPLLKNFSIRADEKYMLPCLKEAFALKPDIKLMGTPWTAPAWMKDSKSMCNGSLLPEYYEAYALYFVRYIQSYAQHGIKIYAITPQNEPLFTPPHYPGMRLTAAQARDFIKTALGPAFRRYNIDTRIFIYDHNWDRPDYPLEVLEDPEARQYISGVAWHVYGGRPDAMSLVHDKYPDIEQHFTEASGGEWIPEFEDAWMDQTAHIIRVPRNWSQTFLWWNMALDENHGPCLLGDWSTCRGLLGIDQKTSEVKYELDYYTIGHLSKFVQPGAVRVASNQWPDDLENVAFVNPDNSKVLVVSNRTKAAQAFTVAENGTTFEYTLPAQACATLVW